MTIQTRATQIHNQVLTSLKTAAAVQPQEATQVDVLSNSRGLEMPDARKLLSAHITLQEPGVVHEGTAQIQEGDARRTYTLEKSEAAVGFLGLFGVQQEVTRCTVDTNAQGYLWRTTATFDQKGKVLFMDSFDATDFAR